MMTYNPSSRTQSGRPPFHWTAVSILIAACTADSFAAEKGKDPAELRRERMLATVQGFVDHVADSAFDQKARTWVTQQWPQRRDADDVEMFICEALAVLDRDFKKALDAYEAEDYSKAAEAMAVLSEAKDPYLAANARVFEIKALVEAGRVEDAAGKLAELLDQFDKMKPYTVHVPELHFLLGFCQLEQLEYEQSRRTMIDFLKAHPEAPARLRTTAVDIVGDLSRHQPGDIGEVADLMGYAGRRLALGDSGQNTRQKQDQAVALLDELIKKIEEQEKSGQCKKGGGANPKGKPGSGARQSRVSAGPTQVGPLRTVIAQPGEQWGSMRAEQRARILQSLKGQFPSRYRELVKQYYETLSKQP